MPTCIQPTGEPASVPAVNVPTFKLFNCYSSGGADTAAFPVRTPTAPWLAAYDRFYETNPFFDIVPRGTRAIPNHKRRDIPWEGMSRLEVIGRVGVEPTRSLEQRILSPRRLPIPPPPHKRGA
jgi:hypothetical protein